MATALVNAPLSTKVTASEKDRFVEICERIGTTPANAMRMFVSAFTAGADFPSTREPLRLQRGDACRYGRCPERPQPHRAVRQR